MVFRITFEDLNTPPAPELLWRSFAPRFRVWSGSEPLCVVRVELSSLYAQQLLKDATDTTQQVAMESRLLDVLLRFAVRRIIEQLRAGTLPTERTLDVQQVQVEEHDLPLLRSMLGAKTCEYQLRDGRALLCSAAARDDETVVDSIGRHQVAPTSTAACLACQLPDTDFVCSRLLHPAVRGFGPTMGGDFNLVRQLVGAACDLGRPEIAEPSRCRPDGHPCWAWLVEPELEAPALPAENALGEAFDFLNAVWELHFKRPLLRLRSLAADGRLALPCRNRGEFHNAMSALDDLLKLLDIADHLLPKDKRGIPKDHTFARLQACLEPGLDQADLARLEHALGLLRATNDIRVASEHAGTRRSLPEAFERLGLRFSANWPEAWGGVQAKVMEALGVLRSIVEAKRARA